LFCLFLAIFTLVFLKEIEMNTDLDIESTVKKFKAASNENRLKIILLLYRDKNCYLTEITNRLAITQPTISQQLGILYNYGIIKRKRNGKSVIVSLTDEGEKLAKFAKGLGDDNV
jgi:DNA-binding transcriptional ArsR family regulator